MKYNIGICGGSFNPLHIGHIHLIINAANQCKNLIIVISEGEFRDEIDISIRYRWIYNLTKHIGNVKLFVLKDKAKTKDEYKKENWLKDAEIIKKFAEDKIDVIFCGNDYDENSFWGQCYPDAQIKYIKRDEISSTKISRNPYLYWDFIPNVVRPYYVKKVLHIGGESTGKSTLTINLANYYNTNYVEEVGREISQRSGNDLMMIEEDFLDILLAHKIKEKEAIQRSKKILFEDTDCLTTKFYMHFICEKNKLKTENLANSIAMINSYDLILFLEPDIDFVQDGSRSEIIASKRQKYSEKIKDIYLANDFKFKTLTGSYSKRFDDAVCYINELFKIYE